MIKKPPDQDLHCFQKSGYILIKQEEGKDAERLISTGMRHA